MIYAFVVGLVLAFYISQMNAKEDPVQDDIDAVDDANPARIQTRLDAALALIQKLEGQRDRACHALIAIIGFVWLGTTFAIVSSQNSSMQPYSEKTEL